ncbi:putative tetratricopeptide-like helical domain superfamily [Helianthus annuus]|nr:putative tetratricopeptide-like helical domain superfamily [Helianthus annuus]
MLMPPKPVFKRIYVKDLVSWNTMINGFSSNGMILEAFDLLRQMQLTDQSYRMR